MSMSFESSDDISLDLDISIDSGLSTDSDSVSEPTSHSSHSQTHSSPAVPVSVALDPSRPFPLSSIQEMGSEVNRLRMTVDLMQKELIQVTTQFITTKARYTVMRARAEAKAEYDREMLKSRLAMKRLKTNARCVAYAAIRAQQAAEQEEQAQKEREAAQKEAQKKADDAALYARDQWEMRNRSFLRTS